MNNEVLDINPLNKIKGTEEYLNIVERYERGLNILLKQKVRNNEYINNQIKLIKKDLEEPINRTMRWVRLVEPLLEYIHNQQINEIEVINEYKEYINDLNIFEKQNLDVGSDLELDKRKISSLSNKLLLSDKKLSETMFLVEKLASERMVSGESLVSEKMVSEREVLEPTTEQPESEVMNDDELTSTKKPLAEKVVEETISEDEELIVSENIDAARKLFEETINDPESVFEFPNEKNADSGINDLD